MKNEKVNLVKNYLNGQVVFKYSGKISEMLKDVIELLHHLEQFECPDMYAKKDNKVLVLEHFEFDGSKEKNKKGMRGINEENAAKKYFDEQRNKKNEIISYRFDYSQTSINYLKNFEKHFYEHYSKINCYKQNLILRQIINNKSK